MLYNNENEWQSLNLIDLFNVILIDKFHLDYPRAQNLKNCEINDVLQITVIHKN